MVQFKMVESTPNTVARTPEDPLPEDVLAVMEPGEPYSVGDLLKKFPDVSRWTIQRRLEALYEDGQVNKKKHNESRVTWWIGEL